jgi:hypothetical protein
VYSPYTTERFNTTTGERERIPNGTQTTIWGVDIPRYGETPCEGVSIEFSGIWDVLVTEPLIRGLKHQASAQVQITFSFETTKPENGSGQFAALVQPNYEYVR